MKAQLSSAALAIVLTGALCACGSGSKSGPESSAANAGTAAAVGAVASSAASTTSSQFKSGWCPLAAAAIRRWCCPEVAAALDTIHK